ncbi:unnamed protein product [Rotaria sp. Silwood1]|nr:unnamed protein product [Rotaria sp. Silwood1]
MLRFTILLLCVLALLTIVETTNNRRCGALCRRRCLYGFVLNRNGCPTCRCKTSPCEDGQAPLPGYFCGRSRTRRDCPRNYACLIAPNDAYAVCCHSNRHFGTKPGSCPQPSNRIGACYAACTIDKDCPGNRKCCGNCPRICVQPLF